MKNNKYVSAPARVSVCEDDRIIIRADQPDMEEDQVIIYMMAPVYECTCESQAFSEPSSSDLYVAVPNGKSISLNHIPSGDYSIRRI